MPAGSTGNRGTGTGPEVGTVTGTGGDGEVSVGLVDIGSVGDVSSGLVLENISAVIDAPVAAEAATMMARVVFDIGARPQSVRNR